MSDITLKENQAALLLEEDEDGEIYVKVVQNNKADQIRAVWAFIDGAIWGLLIAVIYNKVAKKK